MERYLQFSNRKSKNNYPHRAEQYYPYGYVECQEFRTTTSSSPLGVEIRFDPPHQNEVLYVTYMEGERIGPFELRLEENDESQLLMCGNLSGGLIDGFCEIYDPEKGKVFEGTWVEGARCGTCIEYEYGSVSFQGNYHNDKRNGYGWEYDDNELQRSGEWYDGVYQEAYSLAMQEYFVNSGLGMILSFDKDDLLVTTVDWRDGKANGDSYSYNMKEKRLTQKRLYLHGDEIDRSMLYYNPIIGDIAFDNGMKWHGEIDQNMTMGNGELVDSQGKVLYSGQMFLNKRYGHGTSFVNGCKEYEGEWSMDVRMGNGREYNPKGEVVREGVWINDQFCEPVLNLEKEPSMLVSHYFLTTFHIGDNLLNDIVDIDFSMFVLLEDLQIGKSSLKELSEMNLNSLSLLKRVEIGDDSLTLCIKCLSPSTLPLELRQKGYQGKTISMNENRIKSEMKKLSIMNCTSLESVKLGNNTCSDFYSIVIENLPSLKSLEIGTIVDNPKDEYCCYNFHYSNCFELINLPKLEHVLIGNRSFFNVEVFRLQNLPSLKLVEFGVKALFGRRERRDSGSVDLSCMSFRDLPCLESIRLNNNFVFYRKVVFENIPNCHDVICKCKNFPSPSNIDVGENLSDEIEKVLKGNK